MGVYEDLGVRTIINASGTLTRLGGTRMDTEVLDAMVEASQSFVDIGELQASASAVIAECTGAEAGYVVAGASAGLTLGVAACVAGMDIAKMDRLPDTQGMKNEVVVQRGHRNAYDHALRAAGIRFVEVGYLGFPGAGGTFAWQIDEAITEHTAAVACPILDTPGTLGLSEVVEVAHAKGVPVIVDAAAALPPRFNLRRFITEGADLVAFSGGKSIGGPQASGILAGKRDLIASVALQHQDMDVRSATWSKRTLLAEKVIAGIPHQGFGRSMKVGREEVVGLIVALRRFVDGSDEDDFALWMARLDVIQERMADLCHVTVSRESTSIHPVPLLVMKIDENTLNRNAYTIINELLDGTPSIAVAEARAEQGIIMLNPQGIGDDEALVVASRLQDVLRPTSSTTA